MWPVVLCLVVFSAAGCGESTTALRVDVEAYLARMQAWAPVDGETARTLERILETEFVDEAAVRRQIAESTPRLEAHLAAIRAYTPATRSVEHVHAAYVGGYETLLRGFATIDAAFATGDWTKLTAGRAAMSAWRDALVQVAADLRYLADRSGASRRPQGAQPRAWTPSRSA